MAKKTTKNTQDDNPYVGRWAYRSLLDDPDVAKDFDQLEFGRGTIEIEEAPSELLRGTIGGPGWQLELHGSRGYGSPGEVRFQGKGIVGGEEWVYAYVGWLVPVWPNSDQRLQRPAIVGSVTRVIPHSSSDGGVSPAGVVASFYAVKAD